MIYRKSKNDRAVSDIVGTVLLVGLTVILAAAVGQYAFGIVDDLTQPVQAGVQIQENQLDEQTFEVVLVASDLSGADSLQVSGQQISPFSMNQVGETVIITAPQGEVITVVASRGSEVALIRTHTVGQ